MWPARIARLLSLSGLLTGCNRSEPRVDPPPSGTAIEDLGMVSSSILGTAHRVRVFLPRGYAQGSARYPVLYLNDGQDAFGGAGTLNYDHISTSLVDSGAIRPVVIVAVSAAKARIDEYTPNAKGPLYTRFLAEELKPMIDAKYRTLPDAPNTAIGGYSQGGVSAWHVALELPQTFGMMFSQSGTLAFALPRVQAMTQKLPLRIYFDRGTQDGEDHHRVREQDMRAALSRLGWAEETDFKYQLIPGATHTVVDFSKRADAILRFLFPAR